MGEVVRFPQELCSFPPEVPGDPALLIIFPVVRIERHTEAISKLRGNSGPFVVDDPELYGQAGFPLVARMQSPAPDLSPESIDRVKRHLCSPWGRANTCDLLPEPEWP